MSETLGDRKVGTRIIAVGSRNLLQRVMARAAECVAQHDDDLAIRYLQCLHSLMSMELKVPSHVWNLWPTETLAASVSWKDQASVETLETAAQNSA